MSTGRIFVTGGAGFIGANLVRMLLAHGYQVTVLDNLSTGRRGYLEGLPIEMIEGDILDTALIGKAVQGHDGVIHLAAQTGVPGSLADPQRDCLINVTGTLSLLEVCRSIGSRRQRGGGATPGGPKFVFASSNAPLGRQPPPASEDKAPLPISPYGASKLAGEAYCLAYHGSWGLDTVVLRFGNVYGPFSAHKDSVVAKFFKNFLTKREITIDGDGRQTRDFIYVDDLCRAILLALEKDARGEVLQIATGVETSILELAALLQEVVGVADIVHGKPRQGDIRRNYSSINKIKRLLEWEPTTALIRGLHETYAWFKVSMPIPDMSR